MCILDEASHGAYGYQREVRGALNTSTPARPLASLLEPHEHTQLGRGRLACYRWWTPHDDKRRFKKGAEIWRTSYKDIEPPTRGIGYRTKRKDGRCDRTGYEQILQCSHDESHRWRAIMPCRSGKCKTCFTEVKGRRGTRKAKKMGGAGVGFAVLTLPPDVCERVDWRTAVEVRRWIARIIHQWLDYWYGYVPFKTRETRHRRYIEVGSYVALHPCGEHQHGVEEEHEKKGKKAFESPDWRPHYHAGYSLCLVDSKTGDLHRISGFRTPQQLTDLRWRWTSYVHQLRIQLGLIHEMDDYSTTQNVHVSYRDEHDTKRLLHRLSYDLRPFPDWYSGDDVPVAAYRVVGYGLAAPNSRHAGQARTEDTEPTGWRAAVELVIEPEPKPCRHEGCPGHLKIEGLPYRIGTDRWTLMCAPLLLYDDESETAEDTVFSRGRVEWISDDWCVEPDEYTGPMDLRL